LVRELVRGGPAAKAGLRAGDRIVAIGDSRIERSTDVSPAIVSRKPGDEVQIKLSRGGKERTETVTLGTRPERSGSQSVPDLDRPAPQPPDPPTNP
ncbi:MAG: PDZ domain-containing protein, partial [Solirubrobacteraceae bacterium]